jgi:hypothetical protein
MKHLGFRQPEPSSPVFINWSDLNRRDIDHETSPHRGAPEREPESFRGVYPCRWWQNGSYNAPDPDLCLHRDVNVSRDRSTVA